NTAGTSSARSASSKVSQLATSWRLFLRISTTSKLEQPPTPSNSISIGRTPRLRPPWSGGPSITTAWPLPDSPTNMASPTHFTLAFIYRPPIKFARQGRHDHRRRGGARHRYRLFWECRILQGTPDGVKQENPLGTGTDNTPHPRCRRVSQSLPPAPVPDKNHHHSRRGQQRHPVLHHQGRRHRDHRGRGRTRNDRRLPQSRGFLRRNGSLRPSGPERLGAHQDRVRSR